MARWSLCRHPWRWACPDKVLAALGQRFRDTGHPKGLQTFVDPVREGNMMNARAAAAAIVHRVEFSGEAWLHFPNIVPDNCILRATTADERGNLTYEHEGPRCAVRIRRLRSTIMAGW